MNIVDEIQVEDEAQRLIQEEEEKKDMNFEDYKEAMVDHIEGAAANEREARDSADEGTEEDGKKSKVGKQSVSKKGSMLNRTSSQFNGDDAKSDREGLSKRSSKKSELNKSAYQTGMTTMNQTSISYKYELPAACMVSMMKKVLIDKMPAKYFLASHPYPKIEGEMVIFKPKKVDQTQGKDVITYRDYSLRKRLETAAKVADPDKDPFAKRADRKNKTKTEEKEPEHEPNLQCLEIDVNEPLTREEWNNFISVVEET